jgi:hypothetical protein
MVIFMIYQPEKKRERKKKTQLKRADVSKELEEKTENYNQTKQKEIKNTKSRLHARVSSPANIYEYEKDIAGAHQQAGIRDRAQKDEGSILPSCKSAHVKYTQRCDDEPAM